MTNVLDMYVQLGLLGSIGVVFIWTLIRNNNAMTAYVEQSKQQGELLSKIYEALKPQTLMQANDLMHLCIDYTSIQTKQMIHDVIRKNTIHEEGHESIIVENMNGQIGGMRMKSCNLLHRFSYSGKPLDYYLPPYTTDVAKICYDEVFAAKKADEDRTNKNVDAVFQRIKSDGDANLNNG